VKKISACGFFLGSKRKEYNMHATSWVSEGGLLRDQFLFPEVEFGQ
jgi:hypothetical protein